ncbi:hypothetical protein Bca52824_017632 [Brassica carinata]|uniref:CAP-Gly domain-containing protein n=1 Tax=Brassica carinata TaxID=52824 RepID=A0A8X7VNH7_BRACI|nr:hypothetical protein Bca52824_017632 [Brassica carinata]
MHNECLGIDGLRYVGSGSCEQQVYETSYEERQNSAKGVCSSINMYGIKSSSLFPHLSRFDTTAKFCQLQDCKDSGLRQGFYVSELHTMLTKTLIQASININRLNTFRQLLNERDLCNLSLCDVSRSSPDCCFTDAPVLSDSLIKPVSIKITEAGSPTPHGDLQKYAIAHSNADSSNITAEAVKSKSISWCEQRCLFDQCWDGYFCSDRASYSLNRLRLSVDRGDVDVVHMAGGDKAEEECLELIAKLFKNFKLLVLSSCEGISADVIAATCRSEGKHNGTVKGVFYFNGRSQTSASFVRSEKLSRGISLLQALELRYQTTSTKDEEDEMYVLSAKNKRVSIQLLGGDKIQDKLSRLDELTSASLPFLGVSSLGCIRFDLSSTHLAVASHYSKLCNLDTKPLQLKTKKMKCMFCLQITSVFQFSFWELTRSRKS